MRPPFQFAPLAVATALAVTLALVVLNGCSGGSSGASSSGFASSATSSGSSTAASNFDGAALPANVRAPGFTLADLLDHRPVSVSQYRGQVVVLAFLYSTCGATCVVIAQQIRGALDELPHLMPAVLFVSTDPTADTPAHVRGFLHNVSLTGRVHYLTGSLAQLRPIWRSYGVTPASAGRARFDDHASVLLLDSSVRERVLFQSEQLTPESLAHDIRRLQTNSKASGWLIP
jgi:protein SCO1/2